MIIRYYIYYIVTLYVYYYVINGQVILNIIEIYLVIGARSPTSSYDMLLFMDNWCTFLLIIINCNFHILLYNPKSMEIPRP